MNPVETYIYNQEGEVREILSYLHDLFTQRYGMTYRIRFRIPFYDITKWVCYVNPQKKGGVELCFLHGRWMDDPNNILESKGRKQIHGITYKTLNDIDEDLLISVIEEAIRVDPISVKELKLRKK